MMAERRRALDAVGVPMVTTPGDLATGLTALVLDAQARAVVDAPATEPTRTLGCNLDEDEGKTLLGTYGLPTPQRRVAADRDAARAALAELCGQGGAAVVKVLDAAVLHKSDVGGVHVGVRDPEALDRALDAIDAIPAAHGAADGPVARRYLLEEMADQGTELIVGAVRDPVFGPTVLLGLGGVVAELAGEPILRLAPLSAARAEEMVGQVPAAVLDGFRGAPPVDRAALAAVLRAVGDLICDHTDVVEVDLNPVRVTARGPVVLDAVVLVAHREENDVQRND